MTVESTVRRLLVKVDVRGYSVSDDRRQAAIQSRLNQVLSDAARAAGLNRSRWECQAAGDGELAVLPRSEAEPAVVDAFARELNTALGFVNNDLVDAARLRLRLAIHSESPTGPTWASPDRVSWWSAGWWTARRPGGRWTWCRRPTLWWCYRRRCSTTRSCSDAHHCPRTISDRSRSRRSSTSTRRGCGSRVSTGGPGGYRCRCVIRAGSAGIVEIRRIRWPGRCGSGRPVPASERPVAAGTVIHGDVGQHAGTIVFGIVNNANSPRVGPDGRA